MGFDAGFDMVPRLTNSEQDRLMWQEFVESVHEAYENDDQVEFKARYIEFKTSEHLRLPIEGHKFLRFGSKISGQDGQQAEEYIKEVTRLASGFGSRIRRWSETDGRYGFYDWEDVKESLRSCEQETTSDGEANGRFDAQASGSTSESKQPCYSVEPIPKRGKGFVARVNISTGTRIIAEKPLFEVISSASGLENVIVTKVKALSKGHQRQYLSLHNNHPGKTPFSGIFRTNALPCGPSSLTSAVYPTICLINHNCLPNSYHSWNSATSMETVHAGRDIKAGEEITISYMGVEASGVRRAKLKNAFGFDCTCELCSLPKPQILESDARRLEIERLDQTIGDPGRTMMNPNSALADCQRMQQLLKHEYSSCPPLESRLYYDAFQISIIHGDQARASVFAGMVYKAGLIGEGEDNPGTARMKDFMNSPTQHQSYGISKAWRTLMSEVPKGLGEREFGEWLWRRAAK